MCPTYTFIIIHTILQLKIRIYGARDFDPITCTRVTMCELVLVLHVFFIVEWDINKELLRTRCSDTNRELSRNPSDADSESL